MDFHYKTLATLGYQTHVACYLNGASYEAEEAIVRSTHASHEDMQNWADSVRQSTPEIEWDNDPWNKGQGKFFGVSGHYVGFRLKMRGKPAQAKPTHVA